MAIMAITATPGSELDPTIWSQFPYILLPIIIENTADFPTLEAWCLSTKHSSYLHRIAKQETYRTYTINTKPFRRTAQFKSICRVRDENDNDDVASDSKEADQGRNELYERLNCAKFHQENARHVQRLVLDLECLDLQRPNTALPFSGDLGFVCQSLLTYATRLEEIEQNGILRQGMLDRLLETPSLKILKIREMWSKYLTRWDDILLTWQKLGQCSSLKVLHVAQLFYTEAVGLAVAIRGLHNLEELRVKASELPLPGANRLGADDLSPLKPFLQSLYRKTGPGFDGTPVGFPAFLKKLALVDYDSRLIPASLHGLGIVPLKHLTHLHLDLLYDNAVVDLIDNLNPSKLTHLTLSSVLDDQSHWFRICEILARHSSTLRQITLFNAWLIFQPYSHDVDPPWQSFMEFSQLYLAKHTKSSFFIHDDDDNLHFRIFGNLTRACKWGLGVRHVRIDQVDINGLKVNRIDQPCDGLEQLRVLVLRALPEPAKIPMGHSGLGSLPYPHEPFGPSLPDDMNTLKEFQIAKAIANQKLPSLRIISVGRYRFWVQRPADPRGDPTSPPATTKTVVWYLRRALEDPHQESDISRLVRPDDWKFLADRSDCLAETASDEPIRLANRLVYYRKMEH